MATVLFVHDGYMSLTDEGIFSETYDNRIVERYLNIADSVIFMVRTCKYSDNEKLNKITVENFEIIGVENFKSPREVLKYRGIIENVKREVQRADYIIARIPSDLGFLAAKYAKKFNKRYMVEVVGCPWDSLRNHSILGKLLAPRYYLKQKKTIRNAPYAIYVTNEFLQKRYPCEGKSIGCSDVELENADETVIKKRIEKIKTIDVHSLVFGTMGTLHMKYKGFDTVIKALAKLNSEGYSYKYCIAGSGDDLWLSNVVRKYNAEDFVRIIPPMPHEHVFKWLDNIDVYIQPSKTEGMPRALIEAMSRGLPSVGTNVGGIPELLGNESIFRVGAYKQLIKTIKKLSKPALLKWAYDNFERSKTFGYQDLINQRAKFYNSFLKG